MSPVPDTDPTSGDAELAVIALLNAELEPSWDVGVASWYPGQPFEPPFVGVRDLSDTTTPESADDTLDREAHLIELRIFASTSNKRANLVAEVKRIIRENNQDPTQGFCFMKKAGVRNLDSLSQSENIYQSAITITLTRYDTGGG